MAPCVLVDTGPLVAWLIRGDQHHGWAANEFARLPSGLFTCEPVLSETTLILAYHGGEPGVVMELVSRGVLKVPFGIEKESEAIGRMMRRYRSVPMSLADACLVRMSEVFEDAHVLTTDSDFCIYRRFGRRIIATIMPASD